MSTHPYPAPPYATPAGPPRPYPVRVDASLDQGLSRWLWLVKWFLAIPHYLVLALLWAAFVVLSVVALVAIVVTGRYPRSIFDFNVGVLRWTWRVAYYTYGGLGTDHYPPFTIEEVPDYPAHLEVPYPDHLGRGLALVKWWLLAIPHYLVIALFLGTGWYVGSSHDAVGGPGLIGVLVLVAGVVLLVTGTYPQPLFDFVLGLNRWVLRVAAYAGLMTDEYPPFRLDTGGTDPGTGVLAMGGPSDGGPPAPETTPAASTPPTPAPAPTPAPTETAPQGDTGAPGGPTAPVAPGPGGARPWTTGRISEVVVGSLLVLIALGLLPAGAVVRLADGFARDDDGYLMSGGTNLVSARYALVSDPIRLSQDDMAWRVPQRLIGTAKVEVTAPPGRQVFVGIAPTDAVDRLLSGVATTTVTRLGNPGSPAYVQHDGGAPAQPPGASDIWWARAQGTGVQHVTWKPQEGDWTVVVMNADGSRGLEAMVSVGATVPGLGGLGIGLLVGGLLAVTGGVFLLWRGLRRGTP